MAQKVKFWGVEVDDRKPLKNGYTYSAKITPGEIVCPDDHWTTPSKDHFENLIVNRQDSTGEDIYQGLLIVLNWEDIGEHPVDDQDWESGEYEDEDDE